jgi:hypothetical protein
MKEKNKDNFRQIRKSEIFIDYTKIRNLNHLIDKNNWTIGLIIDFLIKNKIILIKKYKKGVSKNE